MAKFETFDRDIKIATAGLSQDAISAALAKFAKAELARVIQSGEGSKAYARFVNGSAGLAEEAVKAPGPIVYVFSWWQGIIQDALTALIAASPTKTGRFVRSFVVIVNGRLVTDFSEIDTGSEVIITNAQPYVRKIQVGAMKMSVPPRIFDQARKALFAKYTQQFLSCQVTFLNIESGVHPLIPYVLKGHQRTVAVRKSSRSSAHRAGRTTLARRKDTVAGQPLTYPALVLNMVQ
ncbi:hypothetical protein [Rhizobium leucaenae]|uniref:hypothetical protein n=1 Tax=Rhizobium leucaenae TaxID=29450 RepID=UPI0007EE7C52|nr:hypothetical protein [Rhizobium leucaenae]